MMPGRGNRVNGFTLGRTKSTPRSALIGVHRRPIHLSGIPADPFCRPPIQARFSSTWWADPTAIRDPPYLSHAGRIKL